MASKIQTNLCHKINYFGSEIPILHLLKMLGFKFNKSNEGQKFLLEHTVPLQASCVKEAN